MKEGWERKKIKEVADVIGGSTPKTNVEEYWGGNNYWVTPAELDGSKYIEKTVRCITSNAVDKTNLILMPSGTVLLSSRAPIGKVCITKAPMYCNQGFKNLICKELLYNEFAYYFLKHNVDYLQSLGTGATFKEISKKVVENVTIPVPSLSEQQHIVEELDLLSSIIEKKKAQLKELDNLAQSLFYEMFGDPITNDKGWEVKKLKDCCKNYDSQRKPITAKDRIKGSIPYYGASGVVDYVRDFIFDGDFLLVSEDGANLVLRSTPIAFCIKGKTWVNNHAHVLKFDTLFQQKYIEFSINLRDISMMVTGCAQPKLTQAALNNMIILYPPLSLQQQFASKIEAIEHQKELIKQSIKEVETLFNSRMDYYFN
ncbi:MAG: restriction endonuclease subunit S [Prevotella sp.]|nr:restriction endonuclease subunit S [Prevotella sp.]